jgi:hypothetical protein
MPSHGILYVGADLALLASLKATLEDCRVVRSPGGVARTLIESEINYSLLIFDNEWSELADFARSLPHRQHATVFTLPADKTEHAEILATVVCLLGRQGRGL